MGSYGEMGFSKLENRGVKIFRRNFPGKLLGEFASNESSYTQIRCRLWPVGVAKKKQKENMNIMWLCVVSGKQEGVIGSS